MFVYRFNVCFDQMASVTDDLKASGCLRSRKRKPECSVRFGVGEQCIHADLGRVVVFGWDEVCANKAGRANETRDDSIDVIDLSSAASFLPRHIDRPCTQGFDQPYYHGIIH